MAVVPISPGPSVDSRPLAFVPQQGGDNPASFGAGTAAATSGLGASVEGAAAEAGKIAADFAIQDDKRAAQMGDVAYSKARAAALFTGDGTANNPGFYNMKGENAINGQAAASKALADAKQQIAAGLPSDRARNFFTSQTNAAEIQDNMTMGSHVAQQRQIANVGASTARVGAAQDDGSLRYNDPQALALSAATIRGEMNSIGVAKGQPQDEIDQQTKLQLSKMYSSAARGAAAAGDLPTAKALFDRYSPEMDEASRIMLAEHLKGPLKNAAAAAAVDGVLGTSMGGTIGPGGNPDKGNALDAPTVAGARQVFDGLLSRGMDTHKALAFAANAVQESRANPGTNPGDGGASHGLLQWNGDRLAAFRALNGGKSPEQTPLGTQLDFVMHELGGSESDANDQIDAAQGAANKAAAVSKYYERPQNVDNEQRIRAGHAVGLANAWGLSGGTQVAGPGAPTGPDTGPFWNVPAHLGDTAHGRYPAAMMATPEGRAAAAAAAASDRASAASATAKYGPLRQGGPAPDASSAPIEQASPSTSLEQAASSGAAALLADQTRIHPDFSAAADKLMDQYKNDPEMQQAVLGKLQQRASAYNLGVKTQRETLDHAFKDQVAKANDGKEDTGFSELAIRHVYDPPVADAKVQEYNEAVEFGQVYKGAQFAPAEDLPAMRAALASGLGAKAAMSTVHGKVVTPGTPTDDSVPSAQGYVQTQKNLAVFDAAVAKRQTQITADPAAYAQGEPSVSAAFASAGSDPGKMQAAIQQSIDMQKILGVDDPDTRGLPKTMAARIVKGLISTSPDKADNGQALDGVLHLYGQGVVKDLVHAGMPPHMQALAGMDAPGQEAAKAELQGAMNSKATRGDAFGKFLDPIEKQNMEMALQTQLGAFRDTFKAGGQDTFQSVVAPAAQTLATFRMEQGMDGTRAAKSAVADIIDRKYETAGITRAPKMFGDQPLGVDKVLSAGATFTRGLTEADMDTGEGAATLAQAKSGQWVASPDGRGANLVALKAGRYVAVTGKGGKPLSMSYSNLPKGEMMTPIDTGAGLN